MTETQHLQRRPGEGHWTKRQPEWVDKAGTAVLILAALVGLGWAMGQPGWQPERLENLAFYAFVFIPVWWLRNRYPLRRSLALHADTLSHVCRLPFGLNRVLRMDWSISLREIKSVEIVATPGSAMPAAVGLNIALTDGSKRRIDAANWFAPGCPALAPILPEGGFGPYEDVSGLWRLSKYRKMFDEALLSLPLVAALRDRGVEVSSVMTGPRSYEFLGYRSVRMSIGAALALVLMMWWQVKVFPDQRLMAGLPEWVLPSVGIAVVSVFGALMLHDRYRPPLYHHVIAVLLLLAASLLATPFVVLLLNGAGVPVERSQTYAVHGGSLVAANAPTGARYVALTGNHSLVEWMTDGTTIQLEIKRGRLGLWEYDDAPLRRAYVNPDRR